MIQSILGHRVLDNDRTLEDARITDERYCKRLLRAILEGFAPGRMERVNVNSVDTTGQTADVQAVSGTVFTVAYLRSQPPVGPWWALVVHNHYVLVNITNGA